jgi:carboxyl-terminal processing protease
LSVSLLPWLFAAAASLPADEDIYARLAVFARVLHSIENNYLGPSSASQLIDGALRGMVATLDEHSAYFPPEVYRRMRGGDAGDIGVRLRQAAAGVEVASVAIDGAASRSGIVAGDIVVDVDGQPVERSPVAEALLAGTPGSKVTVLISRDSFIVPRRFTLERTAPGPPLFSERRGDVLCLRLHVFAEGSARTIDEALRSDAHAVGIVLDLRDNPGGLLDEAVKIVDLFVASGTIVTTEGAGGRVLEVARASRKPRFERRRLAVLVNRGSASASEIVAAALRELGRATVVGTPTYGKGTVQSLLELEDGSALRLTTARYLTPSRSPISAGGLVPDIFVEGQGGASRPVDAQLQTALDLVTKKK